MKKTKLFTSLAALALVLGLGACETTSEEEGTSSEADEPVSSESSGGTTEGGEKDLVFGFELDDGLVGIDGGTVVYNEKSYDYEGTYTANLDEAVRVSYEEGSAVGEYYLSFELDGATRWITITEGNYTNLSYATEKAPLYYNPTYGCWGNEKQTHFLCYNAAYDCLYASSISGTPDGSDVPYIETSPIAGLYYTDGSKVTGFVGDVYQEPTEPGYDYQEPNVGTDTTYRLGALIDEASYRFFNGATTGSTFLGTTQDWDEAAEVYITAISDLENGCTLSTVVDGNLKYIVNTSSTNVTLSDEPTAWTYDSEEQLFIQVSTERGLMYYSSTPSFRAYPNSDDYASYAHVVAYTSTPSDYVPPVQYEIPEPNIGTDPTYKLGALDASAYKYVYLDGKTSTSSSSTFLTTTETFDDAASFYITSVPEYSESNAVTLSYVDSETSSLKYLSSGNSSTTLTYEDDPCVWVWVAEDEGDGYFAVEAAATGRFIALYTSDETARGYAHSNLGTYPHFVPYETEPAEVVIPNPESIVVDGETTVVEGYKVQLTATVYPEGAASDVTWTSSDETYATVNENGLVYAKAAIAEGVTITATSKEYTDISGSITIVITERTIPEGEICSYDFSLSDDNTNSAMDAERTLAYFDDSFLFGSEKESVITSVAESPSRAYPTAGGSASGTNPNTNLQLSDDCLKLGSSGNGGSITLSSSKEVSKIVVYGTCWASSGNNASANLTINGTEIALTQCASDVESVSDLTGITFEFTTATEITITSSNRCMIFVMELY